MRKKYDSSHKIKVCPVVMLTRLSFLLLYNVRLVPACSLFSLQRFSFNTCGHFFLHFHFSFSSETHIHLLQNHHHSACGTSIHENIHTHTYSNGEKDNTPLACTMTLRPFKRTSYASSIIVTYTHMLAGREREGKRICNKVRSTTTGMLLWLTAKMHSKQWSVTAHNGTGNVISWTCSNF